MEAEQIIVGVGKLYVAPALEPEPDLDDAPGVNWIYLGETDDGVNVIKSQTIERFSSDQRTGNVKAVRTEEGQRIETNLMEHTLENLSYAIGGTVTDTPPGVGAVGYRRLPTYAGAVVAEYAVLFRGASPYGANYVGQHYVPRGFFDDDVETAYKKENKVLIPVKFEALENLEASSEEERFGHYTYQDAPAS